MNISRPNMKYQLIAKDIHNDDKVRMHQGWGRVRGAKTLGYIWSIFTKHIYSTEWLTLVDIPEILSFQTVYDMTISLNLMMLKIDLACWGEHARCN